jgi:hypothetical protein
MPQIILSDPGVYKLNEKKVLKYISRFSKISIIEKITLFSHNISKQDKFGDRIINLVSLNRLSILLLHSNQCWFKKISENEFVELNKMVNSLEGDSFPEEYDEIFFLTYKLKTAYTQFVFNQSFFAHKICNTWFLYKKREGSRLNSMFNEAMDIDYYDFNAITFLIKAYSDNKGIINFEKESETFKNKVFLDKFLKILQLLSKNFKDFKKELKSNKKYNINNERNVNLNILREFPLIDVNKNLYFCPFESYIFLKHSSDIYYDVLNYFSNIEKQKNKRNTNPNDNIFSQTYGYELESLVEKFMMQYKHNFKMESEFKIGKSSNLSADYHFYENGFLYLIQLKNKRITLNSQLALSDSRFCPL